MKRTYTRAAIAVLALILLWLWLRPDASSTQQQTTSDLPRSARADSGVSDIERERTSRRKASGRILPEGSITTHQPEQLKDFVLTECKGHQVSLRTALKLIDEAYQDACYFSLEKPLKLTYEVEGTSDKLLTFSLKGKSFLGAVEYIAALSGMEVKRDGLKFTLSPLANGDEPKIMSTRVSPTMFEMLKQTLIDHELIESPASVSPESIADLFRLNGIIHDGKVEYNLSTGILQFHGSEQERSALAALLKFGEQDAKQIKITTKLVTVKNPLEIAKSTLSTTEVQELMQTLSQQQGTELLTAPTTFSLSGQEALVEIKQGHGENWTGLELRYKSDYIGLKMTSANQTEIRPQEDGAENQHAEAQFLVYGGDTQVKVLGNDSRGYYYQITTLQDVDATGRGREIIDAIAPEFLEQVMNDVEKLPSSPPPVAKPVPGQPGFVFSPFNNKIVDLRGIAPGTLVADPQYPPAENKYFSAP